MKAKTGIFCFLIHEVRPATDLEMPLGDNVFVIKVCTCAARFVTGRLGGGQKNIHRAGYTKHTANSNTAYRTCIHALFAFFHL